MDKAGNLNGAIYWGGKPRHRLQACAGWHRDRVLSERMRHRLRAQEVEELTRTREDGNGHWVLVLMRRRFQRWQGAKFSLLSCSLFCKCSTFNDLGVMAHRSGQNCEL